jgi:predicted DNA-binding mobile mystery protein A
MLQDLPLKHIDEQLNPWRELPYLRPESGWLRAIRGAIGMRVRQFAKAAHVAPSTALAAEVAESRGDITLKTLSRYAEVLGCELRYVLIPKQPLREFVEKRAEVLARAEVAAVHHSMTLEAQATSTEEVERQVADLRRKILEGNRSRLWL